MRRRGRQDRQGGKRRWGWLGVGEASCETELDDKEVDDVGYAEGDDMDELKCKYTRTSSQH